MKNLLKIPILCFCLFFSFSVTAQVRMGIKAGLNVSTLSGYKDAMKGLNDAAGGILPNFSSYKVESKAGFHIGIMGQIDLPASNFFIQPELLFTSLGLKEKYQGKTETNSLNYLQIPVYAGYKFNVGLGLDIILGVGPYVGVGIYGADDAFDDYFKRFDFGFTAMGGIQFNKFQVTIGYDLGVIDIMDVDEWSTLKDHLNLSSISNRNAKISVGYFF